MNTIHYHHPDDGQFSLDFLHDNPQKIENRIDSYDDTVETKCIEYDLDRKFTAVYTTRVGGEAVTDLDFGISDEIKAIGEDNRIIVTRLLEIYQAVVVANEEQERTSIEAYKNIDIQALPDALDRTDWTGTATDVAGRLASNLILTHALPNANHRTAVALIQFYLRQHNSDFSMPKTTVEIEPNTYDWQEWVNTYIEESKRLITVRRKNVLLKCAREFGVTGVERKHGIRIELSEYALDMYPNEAKEVYAKQHETLWTDFVAEAVKRAATEELISHVALNRSVFAERIRHE